MSNTPAQDSGNSPTSTFDGKRVRELEVEEIQKRRKIAFDCESPPKDETGESLVGVAFSGGGIRSGAFHLGVIQAFLERNALRFIDFLSTVSGGGYAGGYLTSRASSRGREVESVEGSRPPTGLSPNDPFPYQETDDALPIRSGQHGRQAPRMLKFVFSGYYLQNVVEFLNRYIFGLLHVLLLTISGLIAFSSLVAWAFHHLDRPEVIRFVTALDFSNDIRRAFLPSAVLFLLWLVAWEISFFRDRERAKGRTARILFAMFLMSTLVAIAVLLGTGDLTIASLGASTNLPVSKELWSQISTALKVFAWTSIGASLLPYLKPQLLLRSGVAPSGTRDKVVFWLATRALVYGVPFLFIGYFARENLSGYNDARSGAFERRNEISRWSYAHAPFWDQVRQEAKDSPRVSSSGYSRSAVDADNTAYYNRLPGALIVDRMRETCAVCIPPEIYADENNPSVAMRQSWNSFQQWSAQDFDDQHFFREAFNRMQRLSTEIESHESHLTWLRGWSNLAFVFTNHWENTHVNRYVQLKTELTGIKEAMLVPLNSALHDGRFYQSFEHAVNQPSTSKATKDRLKPLIAEARELDTRYRDSEEGEVSADSKQFIGINRQMMTAWYDGAIAPQDRVYAVIVGEPDQAARMTWFFWSTLIFVGFGLCVSMNHSSCHAYYARKLADMWIEPAPAFGRNIPLTQIDSTESGWPYHLINCTQQLFGKFDRETGFRNFDHFLFSKGFCGSDRTAYCPTEHFMRGHFKLADALAISAAAVSPLQTTNPLVVTLTWVLNLRLGQWLHNPGYRWNRDSRWQRIMRRWPVAPLRVLVGLFRTAETRPLCFVGDGGLFENLGIDALLRRRCRLIIATDAGQDQNYEFTDFLRIVRWARMKHDVAITWLDDPSQPLPLDVIRVQEDQQFSQSHFFVAQVHYPTAGGEPDVGYLIYVKSSLDGDESLELREYSKRDKGFPHHATSDQFYEPSRFESYRLLGHHIASKLLERVPADFSDSVSELSATEQTRRFIELLVGKPVEFPHFRSPHDAIDHVTDLLKTPADSDPASHEQAVREVTRLVRESVDAMEVLIREHDANEDNAIAQNVLLDLDRRGVSTLTRVIGTTSDDRVRSAALEILQEIYGAKVDSAEPVEDAATAEDAKSE